MDDLKKVVPLKKYNVVIPKLFNLITNMSNAQQFRLLEKQKNYCQKKATFSNKILRCQIFSNYIKIISPNRIFIKPQEPLFDGQKALWGW